MYVSTCICVCTCVLSLVYSLGTNYARKANLSLHILECRVGELRGKEELRTPSSHVEVMSTLQWFGKLACCVYSLRSLILSVRFPLTQVSCDMTRFLLIPLSSATRSPWYSPVLLSGVCRTSSQKVGIGMAHYLYHSTKVHP